MFDDAPEMRALFVNTSHCQETLCRLEVGFSDEDSFDELLMMIPFHPRREAATCVRVDPQIALRASVYLPRGGEIS